MTSGAVRLHGGEKCDHWGGAFERLTERAEVPSFSDKTAPAGKKCAYVVAAFDTAGNEGPRSAVVEIGVP